MFFVDDGLSAYRAATPVYWEEWMGSEAASPSPQETLFQLNYYDDYLGDDGKMYQKFDHAVYLSGAGEVVEVEGMEDGGAFRGEVTWTPNGYLYPTRTKDGLWGYVSPAGEWMIEPLYLDAWTFDHGYARVRLPDRNAFSQPRFAYIDPFGTIVLEWECPAMVGPIREGKVVCCRLIDTEQAVLDIMDVTGRLLASNILVDIDPLFIETYPHGIRLKSRMLEALENKECYFLDTHYFSEGLMLASLNGKYGYLNEAGKWAIEPVYDHALDFSNGRAAVALAQRYGYIDTHGEIVIPMIYTFAWPFSEGKGAVQLNNNIDVEIQFLYPDGSVAFPGGYYGKTFNIAVSDPYIYREGLCLVCSISDRGGWSFIDAEGKPVWNDQAPIMQVALQDKWSHKEATSFHNGLANVGFAEFQQELNDYIINKDGEILYYLEPQDDGSVILIIFRSRDGRNYRWWFNQSDND